MRSQIAQSILGPLYAAAVFVRNSWWRVRRPLLVGVRVLVVHNNQVLLVRHRSGTRPWSLPGGGVERGEQLAAAAARECAEETGATVHVERLLGTYDSFFLGMSNYIGVFVATQVGERRPFQSFEIAEARYFPFDALPATIELGSARRVAAYRAGKSGEYGKW